MPYCETNYDFDSISGIYSFLQVRLNAVWRSTDLCDFTGHNESVLYSVSGGVYSKR